MLLPLGLDLPLQPTGGAGKLLERARPGAVHAGALPGLDRPRAGRNTAIIVYGLPSVDGSGVKIGLHSGPPIDPDSPDRTPDTRSSPKRCAASRSRYMPQAAGSVASSRVCLYTMTPDEHFIIDHHPAYPQIVICVVLLRARLQVQHAARQHPERSRLQRAARRTTSACFACHALNGGCNHRRSAFTISARSGSRVSQSRLFWCLPQARI